MFVQNESTACYNLTYESNNWLLYIKVFIILVNIIYRIVILYARQNRTVH